MATVILAVVCCGIYPLVVFGVAQVLYHNKSDGSLIVDSSGTVRGSGLIGQQFVGEKYFHSRPSAAGNGYDATSSGGSNLGPTSKKLADSIAQNVADYRAQNNLGTNDAVPADAVTASGRRDWTRDIAGGGATRSFGKLCWCAWPRCARIVGREKFASSCANEYRPT